MGRAAIDAIQRLTEALAAVGAPVMATLRPGLSAEEVRETVARLHPPLSDLVDSTIEAWWAWQNGIDPEIPSDLVARARIAPDDLVLTDFAGLLQDYVDRLQGYEPVRATFPLSIDEGGQFRCLVRAGADSPWTMWGLAVDGDDWLPVQTVGGTPSPLAFVDYLGALADGLESGRLGVGRHGDIIRTSGAERYGPCPWPDAGSR